MLSLLFRRLSEPVKTTSGSLPVIVPEPSYQTHLERVLSPPKPYSTRLPWSSSTVDTAARYWLQSALCCSVWSGVLRRGGWGETHDRSHKLALPFPLETPNRLTVIVASDRP